jgi:hypothetical protein
MEGRRSKSPMMGECFCAGRKRSLTRVSRQVRFIATRRGHPGVGAVKGAASSRWARISFKRDTSNRRILIGSPKQHKGVRNEKGSLPLLPTDRKELPWPIAA